MKRCAWCDGDPVYERYHDEEWGVPELGEQALFERLVLEGMQAGLSWLTVLKKRDHMRKRFFGFQVSPLANASESTVLDWLNDPGLIRHRGKIEAMIANAQLIEAMDDFSGWVWSYAPQRLRTYHRKSQIPATTPASEAMAKALKKVGFRFVGPTTCYAFMQSVGMVNDHIATCWRHQPCAELHARRLNA